MRLAPTKLLGVLLIAMVGVPIGGCSDADGGGVVGADAGIGADGAIGGDSVAVGDSTEPELDTWSGSDAVEDADAVVGAAEDAVAEGDGGSDVAALDVGAVDAESLQDGGGPADVGGALDVLLSDGGAAPDVGVPAMVWAGHCQTAAPGVTQESWQHGFQSPIVTALGPPGHRIRDLIVQPGHAAVLEGRFTYGLTDKALEDEHVSVWLRACPKWLELGTFTTNIDGRIFVDVPTDLPAGDYAVRMVVTGDLTVAEGVVAVWPSGTAAIVTDVDGTLTTSDWELFQDLLSGADAEMVPSGDAVMHAWDDLGYKIVYLTGRPQVLTRYSRAWLRDHGFPSGPLHLTDSNAQVLPTASGVQAFKGDYLIGLQDDLGVAFQAAYGNATTDIGAYDAAGVPKVVTFIYGKNAGVDGTQPIDGDYSAHLTWVEALPPAP